MLADEGEDAVQTSWLKDGSGLSRTDQLQNLQGNTIDFEQYYHVNNIDFKIIVIMVVVYTSQIRNSCVQINSKPTRKDNSSILLSGSTSACE